MPGEESIRKQQYYGHKRNLFWIFIGEILNFDSNIEYQNKIEILQKNKIALWDVLEKCERTGSLDSNIITNSEVPNDFFSLFSSYKRIKRICFNGKKAYSSFNKHLLKANPSILKDKTVYLLPSTSPANASIPVDIKLQKWKDALLFKF